MVSLNAPCKILTYGNDNNQVGEMAMHLQKPDFVTIKGLAVRRISKRPRDYTARLKARELAWSDKVGKLLFIALY